MRCSDESGRESLLPGRALKAGPDIENLFGGRNQGNEINDCNSLGDIPRKVTEHESIFQ